MSSEEDTFAMHTEVITTLEASSPNHQPSETLVSAVLVKLPEFWPGDREYVVFIRV